MADYRSDTITGSKWTRAREILIQNPHAGDKSVTFVEEEVTQLSDGTAINKPLGVITTIFNDPSTVVNLRSPITNELVGATITHGEIYAILHSAYMDAAVARDAQQV